MTEEELVRAYGERHPTSDELREACARVARWTYVPSQPVKMLELARDIAELREALAAEIAADQVEAFPFYPVPLDPELEL